MKISEITAGQGNIEIEAEVAELSEPRTFNKFGKEGKVVSATIKDDSGQVTLSLWNEQADQVKKGDKVLVKNGYVKEWQGQLQLSTGKFGTLEVVTSESAGETEKSDDNKQSKPTEESLGE